MSITSRIGLPLGVLLPALLLPPGAAGVTAPASGDATAVPAFTQQHYTWEWRDGSEATTRTFTQAQYATRVHDIALVVRARPRLPRHVVRLEVYQNGEWQLHEKKRTSRSKGKAVLAINPICMSGNWCRGTFSMRLKVMPRGRQDGAWQGLIVTFVPKPTGVPGKPPPSKPRTNATLAGPIQFQRDDDGTPKAPTITSAIALHDPVHRGNVVVDLTWNSPPFLTTNPIRAYWVLVTDDFASGGFDDGYYVEVAADQRSLRISGPPIYAEKVPHRVAISVVAIDSRGNIGVISYTEFLEIGCDVFGPYSGPEYPYRTLCEHDPT